MRLLVLAAIVVAVAGFGCSKNGPEEPLPKTGATLEGTVRLGDKLVPNSMVIVLGLSSKGNSATGTTDDQGHYRIENVPLGDIVIGVNTEAAKGMMMGKAMGGVDQNKAGSKAAPAKTIDVPSKYFDPTKSGIQTTVKAGENHYDINLK